MLRKDYLIGRSNIGVLVYIPVKPAPVNEVKDSNPLLDFIFAPDERGRLNGDILHYLSEKTNPEVRQFIEMQLMRDNKTGSNPLGLSDEVINKMRSVITDDDVARFSRNSDETAEAYSRRIGNYFAKERANNASKAYYEREKARLQDLGYAFD